jgi:NTP pyrophosphatase (non-canonical NTP hydrolase)
MDNEIQTLTVALRAFANEREWEQFHSPKNLASALVVEAAELLEHFQWMTEEQSFRPTEEKKAAIGAEAADVFLYLLQVCDKLNIDLVDAAKSKILLNGTKYPVDRVKGSSKKYTET